jgi:predicted nucleic acid-binding protein
LVRVFLDANVIFSAAYDPGCRIAALWEMSPVDLVTSRYVVGEVIRNVADKCPDQLPVLAGLLNRIRIVAESDERSGSIADIHAKDQAVIAAAIAGRCDFLLTGDADFDRLLEPSSRA